MNDIHEGNCRLRFPGIELTISARRIWEHIRHRQINPFEAITARNAKHPAAFVDVVDFSGNYEHYTGDTLADIQQGRISWLSRREANALLDAIEEPKAQQWLSAVHHLLVRHTKQRAVRNAPERFLPIDSPSQFGIRGLSAALSQWLSTHETERALADQWANRIHKLTQKGLKQEELEATSIEGILDCVMPDDVAITGKEVLAEIDFAPYRLSIIPVVDQMSRHTVWVPAPAIDAIRRIKPRIKKRHPSTPQWRDPVLGYWIDRVEWDDLFGPAKSWMTFTHRGEPVISPERPSGLFDSPGEAKACANAHAATVLPKLTSKGNWAEFRLSGGQGYREWLVTLPYYPFSYYSNHFIHRNVLLHVRSDIREGVNGESVLFLQEIQSDWAQQARREAQRVSEANQRDVPVPHWRQEWPALALKLMLIHACERNCDALAWTTGQAQVDRYAGLGEPGLRELYDRTLPKEANKLLRPFGITCGNIEIYWPVNFYIEPIDEGYAVLDYEGEVIGQADTWRQAQQLIPCGGQEQLSDMHGLFLDKSARQAILTEGFSAWGNGINA
jgi:hypothetical protein